MKTILSMLFSNPEEAKEISQHLRSGKGNNEMTWGPSVVAFSPLLQITRPNLGNLLIF
jgi:hypothetical protein